jgi:hypothetical protein
MRSCYISFWAILSSSQSEYLGSLGKFLYRLWWRLNVRIWKKPILNHLLQSITSNNYWIPHKVLRKTLTQWLKHWMKLINSKMTGYTSSKFCFHLHTNTERKNYWNKYQDWLCLKLISQFIVKLIHGHLHMMNIHCVIINKIHRTILKRLNWQGR